MPVAHSPCGTTALAPFAKKQVAPRLHGSFWNMAGSPPLSAAIDSTHRTLNASRRFAAGRKASRMLSGTAIAHSPAGLVPLASAEMHAAEVQGSASSSGTGVQVSGVKRNVVAAASAE